MLIHFEPDIITLQNFVSDDLEEIYSELLRASCRSHHLIVFGADACEWGLENISLSGQHRARLQYLLNSISQYGGLTNQISVSLEITVGTQELTTRDGHRYVLGHENALKTQLLRCPYLLLEHADNDGNAYRHFLSEIAKQQQWQFINYEISHGGGSAIFDRLVTHTSTGRTIVCAVDSDQYAPCDKKTSTVKKLLKFHAHTTYIGNVVVTPSREIENFIPFELVDDGELFPDAKHRHLIRALLTQQGNCPKSDCLWVFFDVKNGISGEKIVDNNEKSLAVQTWLEKKYAQKNRDLSSVKLRGFGDGFLDKALNSGKVKSGLHRAIRSPEWQGQFLSFFEDIYYYLIAQPPMDTT